MLMCVLQSLATLQAQALEAFQQFSISRRQGVLNVGSIYETIACQSIAGPNMRSRNRSMQ
jgi:hypothetical protein